MAKSEFRTTDSSFLKKRILSLKPTEMLFPPNFEIRNPITTLARTRNTTTQNNQRVKMILVRVYSP